MIAASPIVGVALSIKLMKKVAQRRFALERRRRDRRGNNNGFAGG